jgi:type II secretory pathway pseudopilin PulG
MLKTVDSNSNKKDFISNTNLNSFTLTELLFVVSIIFILFALSFPALKGIRETAKGAVCISNLRQISIGMSAYAQNNNGYVMPPMQLDSKGKYGSWGYVSWKYFDSGKFLSKTNDDTAKSIRANVFSCPKTRAARITKDPKINIEEKNYIPSVLYEEDGGWGYSYGISSTVQANIYGMKTLYQNQEFFAINPSNLKHPAETAFVLESDVYRTANLFYLSKHGMIPHHGGMHVLYYDYHVTHLKYDELPYSITDPFWSGL